MSGLSSADIANATANDASRKVEDLYAIIDWLQGRIERMEAQLEMQVYDRPELPSERSQRLLREARDAMMQAPQPIYPSYGSIFNGRLGRLW